MIFFSGTINASTSLSFTVLPPFISPVPRPSRVSHFLIQASFCPPLLLSPAAYISPPSYISICPSASLTFLSLHFLSLNVTLWHCHEYAVSSLSLFLSLTADSINKMPSPQLSFPITAPLSVQMSVASHTVKISLCAECWIEMDLKPVW